MKYSPMIEQYLEFKKNYSDSIVFFRLGDFYEMFFDDAILASKILDITLTGKSAGVDEKIPMCGVPFHSYESYATKLLDSGKKIVIVEQDDKIENQKGIVNRFVKQILTPGTKTDLGLVGSENNYILSFVKKDSSFVVSYSDISTGDIYLTILPNLAEVYNILKKLDIKELVLKDEIKDFIIPSNIFVSYSTEFKNINLDNLLYNIDNIYHDCLFLLLGYLNNTLKISIDHFKNIQLYKSNDFMHIDYNSKKNLEIVENINDSKNDHTLFKMINFTKTSMGERLLKNYLLFPLQDLFKILYRQELIEELDSDYLIFEKLKQYLSNIYDIDRILTRISLNSATPRDLYLLYNSIINIPLIFKLINDSNFSLFKKEIENLDSNEPIIDILSKSIIDNPPTNFKDESFIKHGFNKELDELKEFKENQKTWLLNYQEEEKKRLNLKNIKVGFNKIFGYYIELTHFQISQIDKNILDKFTRKQTLTNGERFISEELKIFEDKILNCNTKIINLEQEIFCQIISFVSKRIKSLQLVSLFIARIDVIQSLCESKNRFNLVKPEFTDYIDIKSMSHLVLEQKLKNEYIKNDIKAMSDDILLITGPNMGGKSTYMRTLAQLAILAQIGSFVPALSCKIKIFDSIFTRIGASDDLSSGKSTFMVEMQEANYAIKNSTKDSLILFDELGRGTGTYDGISISYSIIEYIKKNIKALTLFSTHYHELCSLEDKNIVKNVYVEAFEKDSSITFSHMVKPGRSNKSYGINVARLAGISDDIVSSAKNIMYQLEKKDINLSDVNTNLDKILVDSKLYYKQEKMYNILKDINPNELSPMGALEILFKIKEE